MSEVPAGPDLSALPPELRAHVEAQAVARAEAEARAQAEAASRRHVEAELADTKSYRRCRRAHRSPGWSTRRWPAPWRRR